MSIDRRLAAAWLVLIAGPFLGSSSALAQERVHELDTLVVHAASLLAGGAVGRSVTIIDRQALRSLPVRNVAEALERTLGADLQSRSPAQADLSLRGASYEGLVVLIDGVRVSDPQSGHFDLDLAVPLERVERIEILRGPASAQFGPDAVGGVVNVVTQDGGRGTEGRIEAGSFERLVASASVRGMREDWFGAVGAEASRAAGHREGTDYEIGMMDARGGRQLGTGRLTLSAAHARRDFGAAQFYGPFPTSYERTRTSTGSLRWDGRVGGARTEPQIFFRRHTDEFLLRREDPSFYRNHHTSDQLGASLVTRVELGAERRLAAGGEWVKESLESNNLGSREENRIGVFAEVMAPIRGAVLTFGARGDRHDGFDPVFSPAASVAVPLHPGLTLRAAAGRAFRAPTWTERYYQDPANVGTADLAPERAWSVEAGLDANLPGAASLQSTVFRRISHELIDWAKPSDQPAEPWRTRNVVSATFDGLEMSASVPLGTWIDFSARAEWLAVDASGTDGMVSKYALQPLVRTLGLGATVRGPAGITLAADLRDQTRRGFAGDVLLDARIMVRTPWGDAYLSGRNLTDEWYRDLSGSRAEGFNLFAGIRATLGGS